MSHKIEALKTLIALVVSGMSLDDATTELRSRHFLGANDLAQVLSAYHASLLAHLRAERQKIEDIKRRADQANGLMFFMPQAE